MPRRATRSANCHRDVADSSVALPKDRMPWAYSERASSHRRRSSTSPSGRRRLRATESGTCKLMLMTLLRVYAVALALCKLVLVGHASACPRPHAGALFHTSQGDGRLDVGRHTIVESPQLPSDFRPAAHASGQIPSVPVYSRKRFRGGLWDRRPVFDLKPRHAPKFADVVRCQDVTTRQGDPRNEYIVGAYPFTTSFQVRPDDAGSFTRILIQLH